MLSKEEYKKALDNIKLNYDAEYVNKCNDEFCQAMKGYISVIENLIKEHFELVEKYEMLDNTYSMICEDYLNPQPYKFEDLKELDYVYDKKEDEIVLIIGTSKNHRTNEKFVRTLVFGYEEFNEVSFKENRFYPVYIAK